jgi:hypothetical protein
MEYRFAKSDLTTAPKDREHGLLGEVVAALLIWQGSMSMASQMQTGNPTTR